MDPFAFLPDETIKEEAYYLPISDITAFCQSSRRFNSVICNDNDFWRQKFVFDLGRPDANVNIINWKQAYENYGKVFAFGDNGYGQLGLGDTLHRDMPTQLQDFKAKTVVCGGLHTILIDTNHNFYGFGENNSGQLGLGDNKRRSSPTLLTWNFQPKTVSCGSNYTMIIDIDNNVWACGNNAYRQLGLRDKQNRYTPTPLTVNGQNIKAKFIACGAQHTIIIDLNNDVWSFGRNNFGQLGLGDTQDRNVPTLLTIKAKFAACGSSHTVIIDLDDNIWSFGENRKGTLGLGDNQDRNVPTQIQSIQAKFVACGHLFTMMIDMNNNVLAFGTNEYGQLGLGHNQDRNVPTPILTINGQNIKAKNVACGFSQTMIIDLDNNFLSFGFNRDKLLGLGHNEDMNIPTPVQNIKAQSVSCGYNHTMLISSVSQFGDNVRLIPFNEAALKLNREEFNNFNFLPEYQIVPHKEGNIIASFYDDNDNIYLTELQYDQPNNQILPPI